MKKPKVSVVIPVYGVEKYIERCARSLFEQTLDDIEYLFIDDCTPDISIEILKRVLEEYPNRKPQVIIHRMDKNSGQAKVRNWGINNAKGDYIIHCDSDDWVDIHMYELLYNSAIQSLSDVVCCDYYVSNGEIQEYNKGLLSNERTSVIVDMLTHKVVWTLWNKLFRKSLFDDNITLPNYNMGEDSVIVLQLIYKCSSISYIDKPLYYYFDNELSISHADRGEKWLHNYLASYENSKIVCNYYNNNCNDTVLLSALAYFKYFKKMIITPKNNKNEMMVWLSCYPEITKQVWRNPFITTRQKAHYYWLYTYIKMNTLFCKSDGGQK